MSTDPYRPAIGATSPNDAPLIFKSSEVFPTSSYGVRIEFCMKNKKLLRCYSHVETAHSMR